MKKMLVLLLVLGVAGMASATLSLATNAISLTVADAPVTVAATLDAATAAQAVESVVGNYAVNITGISMSIAAGSGVDPGFVGISPVGGAYAGYVATNMGNPAGFGAGAEILLITIDGLAVGTYDINIWNTAWSASSTDLEDTLTVTVTPEPITMGLLGLGGLFLRRRK